MVNGSGLENRYSKKTIEGSNPSLSVRSLLRITPNLSTEWKRLINLDTFFHYSLRPGLRPGSFDRNPKIKREMKNITTV